MSTTAHRRWNICRCYTRWLPLLLVAVAGGCAADSNSDEAAEGASPARLRGVDAIGWQVREAPDFSVDGSSSAVPPFSRVRGAISTGQALVVVDWSEPFIRRYGRDGALLDVSGVAGDGPGEFRMPTIVGSLPGDSIVLFDRQLYKLSILCPDLTVCHEQSFRSSSEGVAVGVLGNWLIMERNWMPPGSGHVVAKHAYALVDRTTLESVPVDTVEGHRRWVVSGAGAPRNHTLPFQRPPRIAAAGNRVVLGSTDGVLAVHEPGTGRRVELELPVDAEEVTPEEFRGYLEERVGGRPESQRPQYRSELRDMPMPREKSLLGEILPDVDGGFWVELVDYRDDPDRIWLAVDSSLSVLGAVRTPDSLIVLDVAADHIVGIHRDSLNVQFLQVHQLDRQGGS